MGLRDIAANVIIAFNYGAISFTALTNGEITEQNGIELTKYSEEGPMGIKVLVGNDIIALANDNGLAFPRSLDGVFKPVATTRNNQFGALRIDVAADQLYTQFLEKADARKGGKEAYLSCIADRRAIYDVVGYLNQGSAVIVNYEPFSFETAFIDAVAKQGGFRKLTLNVMQYASRESLLVDLLADLWGFAPNEVLSGFTDREYGSIFAYLDDKENNETLAQIMSRLLRNDRSHRSDETFCHEVARYIVSTMRLRMDADKCLVVINGIDQACDEEVAEFAAGFVDMLGSNSTEPLPSIVTVKATTDNINHALSSNALARMASISRAQTLSLQRPSHESMVRYVHERWDWVSDWQAESLVNYADADIDTISSFVHAAEEIARKERVDRQGMLTAQLQAPADFPNSYSAIMPALWSELGLTHLFALFSVWGASVPIRVLQKLDMPTDLAIKSGAFRISEANLVPASKLAFSHIARLSRGNNAAPYILASSVTDKLIVEDLDSVPRLRIWYYAGEYGDVLKRSKETIDELLRLKQYASLCEILPLVVESAEKQGCIDVEISNRILHLRILLTKKQVSSHRFNDLLDELDRRISVLGYNTHETRLALALFRFKSALRQSPFDEKLAEASEIEALYNQCVSGHFVDEPEVNPGDLLGLICSQYALFIKRELGYREALKAYERACAALPDSLELQRGMRSHQACMSLGIDPASSLVNYRKTIQLFHEDSRCIGIPLHEYADMAMSLLLMHEYEQAAEAVDRAIEICDLHGGTEETGRSLNIRGCLRWHYGDLDGAARDFSDAIALMESMRYRYYTWRSQLNLACLELSRQGKGSESVMRLASCAYEGFSAALGERGRRLSDELIHEELITRREYAALVSLGSLCDTLRRPPIQLSDLLAEFDLVEREREFCEHVRSVANREVEWCPYSDGELIFHIG